MGFILGVMCTVSVAAFVLWALAALGAGYQAKTE